MTFLTPLCIPLCGNLYLIQIFKVASSFLTKFWHSDQRLIRNIFKTRYLKYQRMRSSLLLVDTYYLQIFRQGISWKLALRIPFNKWGVWISWWLWSHDFSWKRFLVINFLLEMSTSAQAIKLKLRRNKFGKNTVHNL